VKVGVRQAGKKVDPAEYLLTAFDATSRVAIDQAIHLAQDRILEMVKRPSTPKRH
jgi:peptidyl-tRNA hydrolase